MSQSDPTTIYRVPIEDVVRVWREPDGWHVEMIVPEWTIGHEKMDHFSISVNQSGDSLVLPDIEDLRG